MDFAVWHEGIEEGKGRWVLALDPVRERVLLSGDDQAFYWMPLADCKLLKVATPEQPRLVIPVEAPPAVPSVVMPNRADRRLIERNGY